MELLTNPTVVIILQYIRVSNHQVAHFKLTQKLYFSYMSIKLGNNTIYTCTKNEILNMYRTYMQKTIQY